MKLKARRGGATLELTHRELDTLKTISVEFLSSHSYSINSRLNWKRELDFVHTLDKAIASKHSMERDSREAQAY